MNSIRAIKFHPKIQKILTSFQDIFVKPTSLPPQRSIDHQIILKPDAKPINLRPYHFSYFRKIEIEIGKSSALYSYVPGS
jgi:hypothetical protein